MTALDDQLGVEQTAQVVARCWCRDIRFSHVGRSIDTLEQALLQSDHQPVRPSAPLDEIFDRAPSCAGLGDLPKPAMSLLDMGSDAEPHPRRRISLG